MASDPYGRDGFDDRADEQRPGNRHLGQGGEEHGQQQHSFGSVSYPGHDYWALTGQPDAPEEQRAYDGGWTRGDVRDGYGRRDAASGRDDDRGDWNRPSRAWDDPYGARHGRWDRDEPPIVRDRAFEDDDDSGYGGRRDRGERSTGSGSRPRARSTRDDDSASSWRSRVRRRRKNMPLWQELPLLLIVAFCLAVLIRTFLVQAFFIPSGSMEQTLLVGDRVLVNKVLYDVREPEHGEVVVFTGPDTWAPENKVDKNTGFFGELGRTVGDLVGISQPGEKDFIKRVIGLPGDTVECCDNSGRVTVNGYPLDESSYLYEDSPLDAAPNPKQCTSRRFGPVKVQPGQMFVMGDHRGVSQDSRCQGQVPIANVIGRAFVILWPSSRWDWLPVPDTFKNIPKPVALGPPGPQVTSAPVAPLIPDMLVAPIAASLTLSVGSRRPAWLRRRRR